MGTGDGHVIGMTKILDHGDPALRWNLVLLGDGYQSGQIAQFTSDVANIVAKIQAEPPFDSLWNAINLYRIDVASSDSGAADPTAAAVPAWHRTLISMRRSATTASSGCSK
jgi:hypothetical protein